MNRCVGVNYICKFWCAHYTSDFQLITVAQIIIGTNVYITSGANYPLPAVELQNI